MLTDSLKSFASSIHELKKRADTDPTRYFCPTPPQQAYINDPSPVKLLLGGNQCGKTIASCMLLIYHALGTHPVLKTDPVPIEAWLVTHSHEQSRTIQAKLYEMIPKETLHAECEFVPGKGFRGLAPVVRFKNGALPLLK